MGALLALVAGGMATWAAPRLSPYSIIAELGRGGMGVVSTAQDARLKRQVAVKRLPPDLTRDVTAKQRFQQEAQAADDLADYQYAGARRVVFNLPSAKADEVLPILDGHVRSIAPSCFAAASTQAATESGSVTSRAKACALSPCVAVQARIQD